MSLGRRRCYMLVAFVLTVVSLALLTGFVSSSHSLVDYLRRIPESTAEEEQKVVEEQGPTKPKYRPHPTWTPPTINDPFPALSSSSPLPIPRWNKPVNHRSHGLHYAPPLLISFTRTWPLLLQTVVSYITAGCPPSQIYVVENTGTQQANAEGHLSLQNPFFLNHTQLHQLGVNIIQTPVLLTFAQLQNYYVYLANQNAWPQYFWSHMDVLALSYEAGEAGVTPSADQPGYKSLYTLCVETLAQAQKSTQRWAHKFFAYDHLTLVNRAAYEAVGGWDTFIPYYMTDCDMHTRLAMAGWSVEDVKAGIITDVGSVLNDLSVLYRIGEVGFGDINPAPPAPTHDSDIPAQDSPRKRQPSSNGEWDQAYFIDLRETANAMYHAKHGERGRNTWQEAQRGGRGEPYYYDPRGIAEGIDVITDAGREVYRRKWGHQDCDLLEGTMLKLDDQWRVEKDF